ncbi:MAG: YdhK family protein [Oscillospiraceae bacterium]
MKKNQLMKSILSLSTLVVLAACSIEQNGDIDSESVSGTESIEVISSDMNSTASSSSMGEMMHDDSGEIPEGLLVAENPTYQVGDSVIVNSDHMVGMNGATGVIVGAFDTTVYEVSFNPTNGDARVTNHQWVIQEEITEAKDTEEPLEAGTEVTLEASHMEGMNGATATIESVEDTTVYMVDFEPTTGEDMVRNHKWVTEDELSPK